MSRKYIDCREFPSEMNCTVALSADSESELLDAAVQHAVAVHKHTDSPELRSQLKTLFHDGTPPVEAHARVSCRHLGKLQNCATRASGVSPPARVAASLNVC